MTDYGLLNLFARLAVVHAFWRNTGTELELINDADLRCFNCAFSKSDLSGGQFSSPHDVHIPFLLRPLFKLSAWDRNHCPARSQPSLPIDIFGTLKALAFTLLIRISAENASLPSPPTDAKSTPTGDS
jgi:hypothetical protein